MEKRFFFRSAAASDIGGRKNNEDTFLVDEILGLFIVADGMGGHEKGEVASRFTADQLTKVIRAGERRQESDTLDPQEQGDADLSHLTSEEVLQYAIMSANRDIYESNDKKYQEVLAGQMSGGSTVDDEVAKLMARKQKMGTTLVSILFQRNKAYVTNVGDSRAYRLRDGSVQLLTHDHSWVEERVRTGEITPEEAVNHEKKNVITRSVGFKPSVEADIDVLTVYPHERFLLCSDGLSNFVDEEDLRTCATSKDIHKACWDVVELAKARGSQDNITVILIEVCSSPTITGSGLSGEEPSWEETLL